MEEKKRKRAIEVSHAREQGFEMVDEERLASALTDLIREEGKGIVTASPLRLAERMMVILRGF